MCGVSTRLGTSAKRRAGGSVHGLAREYVERGAAEMSRAQRRAERSLVDDSTACRVDEDRAALHGRDRRGVDHVAGRVRQRHVETDHVARGQQFRQGLAQGAGPRRVVGGQQRVVRCDAHAEIASHARGHARNCAEADEAEALAREFAAHQFGARPLAGGHPGGCKPGLAQQHEGRGDDVFGDRQVVGAAGRVDRDAAGFAGRNVDVVQPDAEPPDHAQVRGALEQRASHLRAIAHDQRAGHARLGQEPRRVVHELRVIEHATAGERVADRGLVHELADDDLGHAGLRQVRRGAR